jgi:16S rRNA processing protein RimM
MGKIKIGKVVNAVGMKGEIKIVSYSDDPERFDKLEKVYLGEAPCEIEGVRYKGATPIVKLAGTEDRNASEEAVGKEVFMDEEDLDELPEGVHYVRDIKGSEVVTADGETVGKLKDVTNTSGQDLFQVETPEGKVILIPGVPEFILDIDAEEKRITVKLIDGLTEL